MAPNYPRALASFAPTSALRDFFEKFHFRCKIRPVAYEFLVEPLESSIPRVGHKTMNTKRTKPESRIINAKARVRQIRSEIDRLQSELNRIFNGPNVKINQGGLRQSRVS